MGIGIVAGRKIVGHDIERRSLTLPLKNVSQG
jgi:hypothetical protein